MKGFKKCCLSSTVDENVRTDCEEGTNGVSDTDWYREIESDMLCVFSVKLTVHFFFSKHFFFDGLS